MKLNDPKKLLSRTTGGYDEIWKNVGKCVFCDLKEKYIVSEEGGVVLTMNIFPYIDGHLMAIPRRHVKSPKELTPKEWDTIRKFSYVAKKLIKKNFGIKSMWTVIREGGVDAQMSVKDHLHVHFIPIDKPDFVKWNYREPKKDIVDMAKVFRKEIGDYLSKFEKKYAK